MPSKTTHPYRLARCTLVLYNFSWQWRAAHVEWELSLPPTSYLRLRAHQVPLRVGVAGTLGGAHGDAHDVALAFAPNGFASKPRAGVEKKQPGKRGVGGGRPRVENARASYAKALGSHQNWAREVEDQRGQNKNQGMNENSGHKACNLLDHTAAKNKPGVRTWAWHKKEG